VYEKNNGEKTCKVCGYDKHIQVCHIKSVSSFKDDDLITEINSKNNLVGLCPNHHWEFDHGFLNL
jgi:predicted restriction endonuclease